MLVKEQTTKENCIDYGVQKLYVGAQVLVCLHTSIFKVSTELLDDCPLEKKKR
jgi:hypothetical protein